MRTRQWAVLLVLTLAAAAMLHRTDTAFTPVLYVMVQDRHTEEISYHAVDSLKRTKPADGFEPETAQTHTFRCFESYIDQEKRAVLNLRTETLSEEDRLFLTENPAVDRLLNRVSALQHDIMSAKVFVLEDALYVRVDFNVNLWWPNRLYCYDEAADTLTELCCFDGMDVIGIRRQGK